MDWQHRLHQLISDLTYLMSHEICNVLYGLIHTVSNMIKKIIAMYELDTKNGITSVNRILKRKERRQ